MAVIISFLLQVTIIYVPFFQVIFKTVPLSLYDWARIIGLTSLGLLVPPRLFHSKDHVEDEEPKEPEKPLPLAQPAPIQT